MLIVDEEDVYLSVYLEEPHVYEDGADHGTSPSLPSLAVESHHPLPLPVPGQPLPHGVRQVEHHLQAGHVVVVYPEPLDVAVKLPLVVLHLTAEVVDHVVDVLVVAVFLFKELGHVVDIVPVQGLGSDTGKAHGDNVGENVSEIQVVSINLESSFVFTDSLSDSFYKSSVLKVYSEESDKSEDSDESDDDEQFAESFPIISLLAEFVDFLFFVDIVDDDTDGNCGSKGEDDHDEVYDVVPGLLAEENWWSEGNNSEEDFHQEIY